MTGTAVSKSALVYERSRSALNVFANGAIRLQAVKQSANASVASVRFRVAPLTSGFTAHLPLRPAPAEPPPALRRPVYDRSDSPVAQREVATSTCMAARRCVG